MANRIKTITFQGIPRPSLKWLCATIAISILLHLLSYVNLSYLGDKLKIKPSPIANQPVKIKVTRKEKKKVEPESKGIVETKLEKTEKPTENAYKGFQDHIAKKQTKTANRTQLNDKDAGQAGANKAKQKTQSKQSQQQAQKKTARTLFGDGAVKLNPKAKSKYQSLLPGLKDLASQQNEGYQDYIDEELEIGERVDINTTSYRYIGYFSNLRKGFSQTWVYPSEAVRQGLQGQVRIEFTIQKNGQLKRIKVLETSGYKILDDAVIDAIKLSSPYPPLPKDHAKDRLTVVANFVYTLGGYAF